VDLDLGSFLVQWAAGGLLFLWVTSRRRVLGIGYGWLLRITYGVIGALGLWAALGSDRHGTGFTVFVVATVVMLLATAVALVVSVMRREAGVSGGAEERERRRERVATMVGGAHDADGPSRADGPAPREFPPLLDLVAPIAGLVALLGAAGYLGGPYALAAVRLVVGAAFLGSVSDAMLLGHWYLVQPGLGRDPLKELVVWTAVVWPFEVAALLWPRGMAQVVGGSIDDGYGGLLGVMWIAAAAGTIVLVGVTWLALRERYYSAVMAATGLLYLAILTAFGTDLVARAVLVP
jgi:hypothetical protein